jgi:hypothetical protein
MALRRAFIVSGSVRLLRLAVLVCAVGSLLGCGAGEPGPDSTSSGSPTSTAVERSAATGLVQRLRHGGLVIYIRHTVTGSSQDDPSPDLSDPSISFTSRSSTRTEHA